MVTQKFPILVVLVFKLTLVSTSITKSDGDFEEKQNSTRQSVVKSGHGINNDHVSFETIAVENWTFGSSQDHLFVLLHIQKTGGTAFEKHLVNDLAPVLSCACVSGKRRCKCPRKTGKKHPNSVSDFTWLLSRFSTGWICGLHPGYTQLKRCLGQERQLLFLTFLRHPLHRFVSEFRHAQRGATWKASKIQCKHHDHQSCLGPKSDWTNSSLDDFINCSSNMAINRQTKMLSDWDTGITCNNSLVADNHSLASAMSNLERFAYFGICEQQRSSQVLFEKTFKLKFSSDFTQSDDNKTQVFIAKLSPSVRDKIIKINSLDMRLYEFALNLFAHRCAKLTGKTDCAGTEVKDTLLRD